MAAGGDAGSFVGKGQNAFQFVHSQGVQLLLAKLGQGSPKEGIACAVGVAHLAGNASLHDQSCPQSGRIRRLHLR